MPLDAPVTTAVSPLHSTPDRPAFIGIRLPVPAGERGERPAAAPGLVSLPGRPLPSPTRRPLTQTLIYLVRHAEAFNPDNIWYGRLDGFSLSERGLRQAEALGDHFAGRPLAAVFASPLTRAAQTASAIAARHDLEVMTEEDIIESEAFLQGFPGDRRLFRNPARLRYFVNPYRPTWGEPYPSIRARMGRAIAGLRDAHRGGEVVAVSHQTPVLVARLMYEQNPKPPWRAKVPCERASITALVFDGDRFVEAIYEPVGSSVT